MKEIEFIFDKKLKIRYLLSYTDQKEKCKCDLYLKKGKIIKYCFKY